MKANWIEDYGGAGAVRYGDCPAPEPGPRDVLVAVKATSVNPIDWKMREGLLRNAFPFRLPYVLGRDFAGVVMAAGPETEGVAPGDEVFGMVDGLRGGAHAEILATDHGLLAKKPRNVNFITAASLPLAAATAMIALEDTARLAAGERVLIHGGAGGVGGIAVQLAKAHGAWVATTCRGANLDYVRSLGADRTIDHGAADFTLEIADLDIVFDTVGAEVHRRSQAVLKPGGRLVYIAAAPLPQAPPLPGITILRADVRGRRTLFERLASLVESGAIKPQLSAVLPLRDAARAYELSRAGNSRGKIVLTVPG